MAIAGGLLALAWLVGLVLAALTQGDPLYAVIATSLLGASLVAARPRPAVVLIVALGAVLVFAATWRYEATVPSSEGTVAIFNGGEALAIRGVIHGEPDERPTIRLYRLEVREVREAGRWQPAQGRVLVAAGLFPKYEYGDLLELKGKLQEPPTFPDFNYRDYLLRQGVVSIMSFPVTDLIASDQGDTARSWLIAARQELSSRLQDALPEPQASLAGGVTRRSFKLLA